MWRFLLILLLIAVPAGAETRLPVVGGDGGGAFDARCPDTTLLRGVELRTGDDVDAIRPICGSIDWENRTQGTGIAGPFRGGTGGLPRQLLCPPETPAVHALGIQFEGDVTEIVNGIAIWCGSADASGHPDPAFPATARFLGPHIEGRSFPAKFVTVSSERRQDCPPGEVGVGLYGRHGIWLDAVGMVCAAYGRVKPVKPLVRVVRDPDQPPLTAIQLCQRARDVQREDRMPAVKSALIDRCLEGYPGGALNSGNLCVQAKLIREGRLPGDLATAVQKCFASLPR